MGFRELISDSRKRHVRHVRAVLDLRKRNVLHVNAVFRIRRSGMWSTSERLLNLRKRNEWHVDAVFEFTEAARQSGFGFAEAECVARQSGSSDSAKRDVEHVYALF